MKNTVKTFEQAITEAVKVSMDAPILPKGLPDNIIKLLNDRIGDEYTAHFLYRSAANWCKDKNYKKATAFFEKEAAGELEHSQKIQEYLLSWNIVPVIPSFEKNTAFSSLVDIINKAYEIEYNLLEKYSSDVKNIFNTHPATYNFLQKYVDIQYGEVEEYSDLLNALQLIDTNNKFEILYFEQTYF